MSLNYEFKNGRPKDLSEEKCFHICMALMAAGVQEITKENTTVIMRRHEVFQAAICRPTFIDIEILDKCIGLKTNVGNESASKFLSKLKRDLELPKKSKKVDGASNRR